MAIAQQMYDGNFAFSPANMTFLQSEDSVSRIEVEESMYPHLISYDDMEYSRHDAAFYDFMLNVVVGGGEITMPSYQRSSMFIYIDDAYMMDDNERIGVELHFGDRGEDVSNNVLWAYAIMSYNGDAGLLAPDYATGYQVTDYFLCMGEYSYCQDEMLTYHGDNWNYPMGRVACDKILEMYRAEACCGIPAKPLQGAPHATCGDVKQYYRENDCCGMGDKLVDRPMWM